MIIEKYPFNEKNYQGNVKAVFLENTRTTATISGGPTLRVKTVFEVKTYEDVVNLEVV